MAKIRQSEDTLDGLIGRPPGALRNPGLVDAYEDDGPDRRLRNPARGPLGSRPVAGSEVQWVGSSNASGGATRKRSRLDMKVRIIEYPAQKLLTRKVQQAIVKSVEQELNRMAGQLKQVKASFKVSWEQPTSLGQEQPVPKVLLVYVIDNSQKVIDQAIRIAEAGLSRSAVNLKEFGEHLSNEGGVNIKPANGLISLSFCSVARIAQHPSHDGIDKMFADLVLHEIGHGMDAEHEDGGVMNSKQFYGSVVKATASYSKKSIQKFDTFLARL